MGRTFNDINQSKILYDPPPRVMEIKTKVNKWDLITSKGNYKQGENTTLRMWENNSKWNNWQRINFQNIQAAHTTEYQKNKPIKKWEKDLNRLFSKEDTQTQGWLTNICKDAQHCSLLEKCKSKLQWDITSHQSEWPSSKCPQTTNAGEGVEKRGRSCTVGGNVSWYSHYGRWYGDSF